MNVYVHQTKEDLGREAASAGAVIIRRTIQETGSASIVLATGASQFQTLRHLVQEPEIDWSRVTAFHLDEYIGISEEHPASFRRYLKERFVSKVGKLAAFHFIDGEADDPRRECERVGELIRGREICVSFIGIGENGHLAFNDPPADFDTEEPYIVVELDEACRRQQLGEGWFDSLDDVPGKAISMSIRQILKSRTLVVSVPDARKAAAVKGAVEGPVTNTCPASILQTHAGARVYLDTDSAAQLSRKA